MFKFLRAVDLQPAVEIRDGDTAKKTSVLNKIFHPLKTTEASRRKFSDWCTNPESFWNDIRALIKSNKKMASLALVGGASLILVPILINYYDSSLPAALQWTIVLMLVIFTAIYIGVFLYFIFSPVADVISGEKFDLISQQQRQIHFIRKAKELKKSISAVPGASSAANETLKFAAAIIKLEIDNLQDNVNFFQLFFTASFALILASYLKGNLAGDELIKTLTIVFASTSALFGLVIRGKANFRLKKLRRQLALVEQAQNV